MKLLNGFLKWLATLAFSLAAGLLSIILLSNNPAVSPLVLRLVMLAAISLICSLLLRIFYFRGISLLLVLLALISTVFSTLVIDYFYDTEPNLAFLTENFTFQVPTLQDIAQVVILFLIALPALLLFKKKRTKRQVVEPRKTEAPKKAGPTISDRIKVAAYQINPMNWNLSKPQVKSKKPKTSSKAKSSAAPRTTVQVSKSGKSNGSKPPIKTAASKPSTAKKLKLPKFGSKAANNDVKLMGDEEHVCPYCLEEVLKNDSRGVSVCKECGTWHHQDCWDVTGGCGVAHRNKL